MKVLRTVVSAIAILAGAALLVTSLTALLVTRAVEDGAVSESAIRATLRNPMVMDPVVAHIDQSAVGALANAGVDVDAPGLSDALHALLAELANDDDFVASLASPINDAMGRLHRELTEPGRPPAPFSVSIDASDSVNGQLGKLPAVGESLPSLALPPVEIELIRAERFEQARETYSRIEYARSTLWWAGLLVLALGLLVSPRKRFFAAKALAVVGAMSLAVALALAVETPERVRSMLPAASDAMWGQLVTDTLATQTLPEFRFTLVMVGFGALAMAAVAAVLAYWTKARS